MNFDEKTNAKKFSGNGQAFRQKWIDTFTDNLSSTDKQSIHFENFFWHVFSYEKLPCLEGKCADDAFNLLDKKVCYGFYQQGEEVIKFNAASHVRSEHLIKEQDFYVVDEGFNWTYVLTHESDCGPYFYKFENKR